MVNGWWKSSYEEGNKKGKVNGSEVSDALAILEMIVLNVVHE